MSVEIAEYDEAIEYLKKLKFELLDATVMLELIYARQMLDGGPIFETYAHQVKAVSESCRAALKDLGRSGLL